MRRLGSLRFCVAAFAALIAVVFPGSSIANELTSAEGASSKITNFSAWEARSPQWAEAVHASYMETAFDVVPTGRCEMRGPDGAYVNEMLVRFDDDGSKSYETRVALVIGNGDYQRFDALDNPVNDATSVSRVLGALGFTVVRGADLSTAATQECLNDFYKMADSADVALLYYAGHGIAIDGVNTLLPVNASFTDETKTAVTGDIPVDGILTEMRKRAASSLLFLDACRESLNRGFEAIRPNGGRGVTNGDGQSRTALNRPGDPGASTAKPLGGFYYVYAAAPGQLASDGTTNSTHSPFTQAFLDNVATPGRAIQLLIGDVTDIVFKETNFTQRPFADGSLTEDISLNGDLDIDALTDKSATFAAEAQQKREEGLRGKAILLALKGIPTSWTVDDQAQPFASTRVALSQAYNMRAYTVAEHSDRVVSIDFNSDGTRVVTASDDYTATIWDTQTGIAIRTLMGHADRVTSAAFSPDGTKIVTGSIDRTTKIWDVNTGETIRTLNDSRSVNSANFSPGGSRIVTASGDNTAKIWDTQSGDKILTLTGHSDIVRSASFNPDGTRIVTASDDNTAKIWDAKTGEEIQKLGGRSGIFFLSPAGHSRPVRDATFSPDGMLVVTASWDGTAKVWDVLTGKELRTLTGDRDTFTSAAFSPDGTHIVTASKKNDTATIWNTQTGKEIRKLVGHSDGVNSAAFSPDGMHIATASDDYTAELWNVWAKEESQTLIGHSDEVNSAAFSPDGMHIVTASDDNTAALWDARSGREIKKLVGHSGAVESAVFSPNGAQIVTASRDGTAKVWNVQTGDEVKNFVPESSRIQSAAFSPDGSRIVTALGDGTARIWDVLTGGVLAILSKHSASVTSAEFSSDGTRIVTASANKTAKVWNLKTKRVLVYTEHPGYLSSAAFSPDGTQIVTASRDGTAKIWDAWLWGSELLSAAYALLPPQLRAEVERGRIRYWEIDEQLLN